MKKDKINDRMEAVLGDQSLQDSSSALLEIALDAAFEEGILRDIPILGSIIGFGRATVSIRDRMFANKLAYFLKEIASIPSEQRKKLIDEINESDDTKVKVGERILYVVDKCRDHESSRIAGIVFRAFLEKVIDYHEFISISAVIDRLLPADIMAFANAEWEEIYAWQAGIFFGTGLIELNELSVRVRDQWDWKSNESYVVDGNDLTVSVTTLGKKLRSILRESERTTSTES